MVEIAVLKKICPASEAEAEKIVYSTDSSCIKGNALAITWPENPEQLQKLVRFALREKISLVPRGGGTSLVGGAVPQNAVVIDIARLNKIKKLFLNEKQVIVEAGTVLDNLNAALAKYNLEFPVRPGSHAACTIGGMIATNAGGMLSPKYGKIEEWLEEITVMDGTGKMFELEGQEMRRFAGTEGCCGIILEAKLRLIEFIKYSTDFFEFDDIPNLMRKVEELKKEDDVIAIEYINLAASKLSGLREREHLLVRYASGKGALDPAEAEKLWKLRENIYSVLVEKGFSRIEDPFFEKNIEKFLDWIKKQEIPCYGHVGYGIVHPHFSSFNGVERMIAVVKELNGKLAAEHGVGLLKRKNAPFAITQNIKELKQKYDPSNILNKNKVI